MLCVHVCGEGESDECKIEKGLCGKIENTFSSLTALISPRFSICMRDSGAIILQCAVIHDHKLILFTHRIGTGCNLILGNVPPARSATQTSCVIQHDALGGGEKGHVSS